MLVRFLHMQRKSVIIWKVENALLAKQRRSHMHLQICEKMYFQWRSNAIYRPWIFARNAAPP